MHKYGNVFVPSGLSAEGATAAHAIGSDTGPYSSLALSGAAGFTLDTPAGAISVRGVRTSAGYFDTLGITAVLGRTFKPDDEVPGRARVVVLSHAFWQERFGGSTRAGLAAARVDPVEALRAE